MRRWSRVIVVVLVAAVLAVVGAVVSLTVFLNGEGLRARVEATVSHALGRPVHIGELRLSLWTGSAIASAVQVGDDPRFGPEPFVTAAQMRLGLEIVPLVLRRQVRIHSVRLESPSIRLARNAAGLWNYASLRRAAGPQAQPSTRQLADLAVSEISLEDGSVLVRMVSGEGGVRDRRFNRVTLSVRHFDLASSFPFTLAAELPAGGSVKVMGAAGPWVTGDASATPVAAHVEARGLDLEAAGLVGAGSGVDGLLEAVSTDLSWSGGGLHVAGLKVESSRLTIGGGHALPEPAPGAGPSKPSLWSDLLRRLSVDGADVRIAALTRIPPGGRPLVYRQVQAHVGRWSGNAWADFKASAALGAGAGVRAAGRFRMVGGQPGQASVPPEVEAHLAVAHLDLVASGLLAPGSAVAGLVEADAQIRAAGGVLHAAGRARVDRLRLARNGQPSPRPVLVSFSLAQSKGGGATTGTLERAVFTLGAATVAVAGSYRLGVPAAVVNLHASADGLPIDQIEAFLPVVGVQLPEGSRLSGGTLTTSLNVVGPATYLAISGPVHVEGTRLMGFDLGSKLSSLARFTGGRLGSASSPGTAIRSLSLDLRTDGGQVVTDHIAAEIAGIGALTGSGMVGPGATLHFGLSLKVNELVSGPGGGAGLARDLASQLPGVWAQRALGAINSLTRGPMKNGIPLLIGGTAKHPTVTPNLGALLQQDGTRR